jgi:hypothetical protein
MNPKSRVPKVCFHHFEFTTYEDELFQHIGKKNVNVYNVTFKSKKTYWSNSANLESGNYNRVILDEPFKMPFLRESEKFSSCFCRLLFQKKFDITILPLSSIVSLFYSVLAKAIWVCYNMVYNCPHVAEIICWSTKVNNNTHIIACIYSRSNFD